MTLHGTDARLVPTALANQYVAVQLVLYLGRNGRLNEGQRTASGVLSGLRTGWVGRGLQLFLSSWEGRSNQKLNEARMRR